MTNFNERMFAELGLSHKLLNARLDARLDTLCGFATKYEISNFILFYSNNLFDILHIFHGKQVR